MSPLYHTIPYHTTLLNISISQYLFSFLHSLYSLFTNSFSPLFILSFASFILAINPLHSPHSTLLPPAHVIFHSLNSLHSTRSLYSTPPYYPHPRPHSSPTLLLQSLAVPHKHYSHSPHIPMRWPLLA